VLRYEGLALEPNWFAFIQIVTIPFLFFLFSIVKKRRVMKPVLLAAIAGCVIVLLLSFSRGGIVGLAVLFVMIVAVERRNRPIFAAGLVTVVAGILYLSITRFSRFSSLFELGPMMQEDFAVYTRFETMKTALLLGWRSPLFGIGIGNFLAAASHHIPLRFVIHNAPLTYFCELGFPSLAVMTAILARNIQLIRRLMRDRDPECSQLGRLLLVQHAAVLAGSMLLPVAYEFFFWLTMTMPSVACHAYLGSGDGAARSGRSHLSL
jgi:O-antigen ligase